MQSDNRYDELYQILMEAFRQSAEGKGKERHANELPWVAQPILSITRSVGIGFPTGQAIKKLTEGVGMLNRCELEKARAEFLGAIVYSAAAIRYIDELLPHNPDVNEQARKLI